MAQKDWSDYFAAAYGTGGISEGMKMAFDKWKQEKLVEQGMPIMTFGADGTPQVVGYAPKGAKVVPPAQMMTPEAKAELSVETGAKAQAAKEQQVNLSKVKRLYPIIDTVEKEWMKTQPIPSSQGGRAKGLLKAAGGFTQTNPDISSYQTFVKGMRAQLARAMGDVGNLSEPEQKAAMELVPKVGDTLEVGQEKLNKIRAFISNLEGGNTDMARSMLQKDSVIMPPALQKAVQESGIKVKSFRKIK